MAKFRFLIGLALLSTLLACQGDKSAEPLNDASVKLQSNRPFNTPEWAKEANIYELNLRQYTPEGTFAAAKPHLSRLAAMGVDVVWIMPIYPISETKRKGNMGSYYASSSFREINPEFGTFDDFKAFVDEIHGLGMHVILDWTANHTGWDHPWLREHPEWYIKREGSDTIRHAFNPNDSTGGDTDWYDIAQLDHSKPALHAAMIEDMKFWLREYDVDGYRCDVAGYVPIEFWYKVRPALEEIKPVFMLAEWGDEPLHFESAFDINYGWDFHKLLNAIAEGKANAAQFWEYQSHDISKYPAYAYHLNFTSNHDENSWNGTEFERMGDLADALWVICATFEGAPLVYSGQEEPLERRLAFFEKDNIGFKSYQKAKFFERYLTLKHQNLALQNGSAGAVAMRVSINNEDDKLIAYTRRKEEDGIIVLVNLEERARKVSLAGEFEAGEYYDVETNKKESLMIGSEVSLAGSGYRVFSTLAPHANTEN